MWWMMESTVMDLERNVEQSIDFASREYFIYIG
jgi:hypothetical protein